MAFTTRFWSGITLLLLWSTSVSADDNCTQGLSLLALKGKQSVTRQMKVADEPRMQPQGRTFPERFAGHEYVDSLENIAASTPTCYQAPQFCTCDDPEYPCYKDNGFGYCGCWSYSSKAACTMDGGYYCDRPLSCVANCDQCKDTVTCSTCKDGYMLVEGQCTRIPGIGSDADIWLKIHNLYRCMHAVPPVTWSNAAATSAAIWADQLCDDFSCMQHSDCYHIKPPAGPSGENLAMGYSTIQASAAAWYNEVSCCSSLPGCQFGTCTTGHFTAMIWKGVTQIGCASNGNDLRADVCRYRSGDKLSKNTANMNGFYTEMVLPAVKNISTCIWQFDAVIAPSAVVDAPVKPTVTTTPTTTVSVSTTLTSTTVATTRTTPPSRVNTTTPLATQTLLKTGISVRTLEAVDGGINRTCRGATISDTSPSYFEARFNVYNFSSCSTLCSSLPTCTGIDYQYGICRIWNKTITTSVNFEGRSCYRVSRN